MNASGSEGLCRVSVAVDLKHKSVRRVHKDGGIFTRRGFQAKLAIRCLGVVGEGDGACQFAIIQHLLVMLR